jgi:putative acetyltransferase
VKLRPPTGKDFDAIREVVTAAFGREAEALIVDGVRAEGVAMVELVVEDAGEILGYVLFSRMTTEPAGRFAGLGPVAVRPDRQGQGIGEALCDAGVAAVRALGADAIVVLGHPDYYPRFGFSHDAAANIASPFADREAFMALELKPGALAAPIKADFPAAFG